jgi:diguanylate cyclase (GGDEF)-like protein/PAS domain S-box-containing protein
VAGLLVGGRRLWPAVSLGAFATVLSTTTPWLAAFPIAVGNTVEALLGAVLVERYARGARCLDRPGDILGMLSGAGAVATVVGATVGVASLVLVRDAPLAHAGVLWLTWWSGNFAGVLLLAPLVLAWAERPATRLSPHLREAAVLATATVLAAGIAFGGWLPEGVRHYPLVFLVTGPLIWAVVRFRYRGVTAVSLVTVLAAVSGTAAGNGPLAGLSLHEALVLLQLLAFSLAVPALLATALRREREAAENTLATREAELGALVGALPDLVWLKDRQGRWLEANPAALAAFGLAGADYRGRTDAEMLGRVPARLRTAAAAFFGRDEAAWQGQQALHTEEKFGEDGADKTLEVVRMPLRDAAGEASRLTVVARDISARRRAELHQRLAARVIENTPDGVMVTGPDGTIVSVNRAFSEVTGYARDEILGERPSILKSGHHPPEFYADMWRELEASGVWRGEIWNRSKTGEIYPEWLSITRVWCHDSDGPCHIAIFSDIARHQAVRERLHHLAYYDALTGLPNRLLFGDRLQQAVAYAQREQLRVALLFLDLDRFKEINDTLGHGVGDGVLKAIAGRVARCLRESDTFSRLGGDEFTVILPNVRESHDAAPVAQKILQQFATPFDVGGHELYLSTSIGIAVFPDHGSTPEELVKHADTAMYRAKENGRNLYQFYVPAMSEPIRRQLEMDIELRRALERGDITVAYQPQIALGTGRIVGLEALARWTHPRHGAIPPDVFIPLAEHAGVVAQLGAHVLRTAARQVQAWRERGLSHLRLAVNLSVLQLRQPGLAETIEAVYAETGLPPDSLELEITEGVLMDKGERASSVLLQLTQMGCRVAIDDFGTGYSSLSSLRRLPIHRLKVDRSFVDHVHDEPNDAAIAATVIAMAHHLKIRVTAEGVELPAQLEFLRRHHCDEAQGFLFSRPRPADEIDAMLFAAADAADDEERAGWAAGEPGRRS